MKEIRQGTARSIKFGPFLDIEDGITPLTALSIAQADIRLSKESGNFVSKNSAGAVTHNEGGYYTVPIDATDTVTPGILQIAARIAGSTAVFDDYMVLSQVAYDAKYGSSYLPVNAVQIASAAPPTRIGSLVINASGQVVASSVQGNVTGSVASVTAAVTAGTVSDKTGYTLTVTPPTAAAIWAHIVEGTLTAEQVLRVALAVLAGKADGGGTTTLHFRNLADSANRVTMTVDTSGDRSAVTVIPT